MRVWLVTVGEPLALAPGERPWRTGILGRELARRGHEVVWWTSRLDHFTKTRFPHGEPLRLADGLEVFFLEGIDYTRNVSPRRFLNHIQIARDFERRATRHPPPDVIVASLPPLELAKAAVDVGSRQGARVVLDVRDLWPDEIHQAVPRPLRWLGRVGLRPLDRIADAALARASSVVATSPAYLEWGRRRGRRQPSERDRVFPHGYPDPEEGPDEAAEERAGAALRGMGVDVTRPILWFVGTFVGSIDLGTVIRAAEVLVARGWNTVQFVLSGNGEREEEWRAMAVGSNAVVFTGWVDRSAMRWLARHATAGLAPYKPGALMGLTNKLIEYLGFGLPVLSSLSGEAKDLLGRHACGLTYDAGDSEALATAAEALLRSPEQRARMAANARRLFEQRFRADEVYACYAEHVEAS